MVSGESRTSPEGGIAGRHWLLSSVLTAASVALFVSCQSCHPRGTERAAASETATPQRGTNLGEAREKVLTRTGTVELREGAPGIGFDDLRYSPALGRVLVPAGRSGRLDLVEPASRAVVAVTGFSKQRSYSGGHDDGVTSADAGNGVIFATDRTTQKLTVIDPASHSILRSVPLAAHPDYVRFVEPTREVWVTEPDADQLEVFSLGNDGRHPSREAAIAVPGGPESLVIDARRSRAYTHLWRGKSVAVDVRSRAIVSRWNNGCRSSRGIALDAAHGLLVAACSEGKATVLDVESGRILSEIDTGAGVDVIDFDPDARHVYIPSAGTATMVVARLSIEGHLREIGRVETVRGAHCVTSDRQGNAYVCDPAGGRLLVISDRLDRTVK